MILPTRLISALCGCIYTSYGQGYADSEGRTPQCGTFFAASLSGATCAAGVDPSLLPLSSPSLSLSAASPTSAAPSSPSRGQNRLYRQTATPSRGPTPQLCNPYFTQSESNRQPSIVGHARSKAEAWLSAGSALRAPCNWNITGIVCWNPSWSKPMNCWYPIEFGLWPQRRRT